MTKVTLVCPHRLSKYWVGSLCNFPTYRHSKYFTQWILELNGLTVLFYSPYEVLTVARIRYSRILNASENIEVWLTYNDQRNRGYSTTVNTIYNMFIRILVHNNNDNIIIYNYTCNVTPRHLEGLVAGCNFIVRNIPMELFMMNINYIDDYELVTVHYRVVEKHKHIKTVFTYKLTHYSNW